MKCFCHTTRDAVGICKACGKGLCTECAADLDCGLACKGRCEKALMDVSELVSHNIRNKARTAAILANQRTNTYVLSLFYTIMGLGMIWMGYTFDRLLPVFGTFGAAFIVYSVYSVWRAFRLPK